MFIYKIILKKGYIKYKIIDIKKQIKIKKRGREMISKKMKKILALALTGAMMIGFTACSSNSNNDKATKTETNSLETIKSRGKLIMGTNPDYPPFEFKDKNQNVVGSDIEIAKEIASDLGVKLEIKEAQFSSLVPMVKARKVDLSLAGMNETPKRKKEVDFSDVYYTGEASIVINKSDADKYKSLTDLEGKKIGAQLGSVPENIAKEKLKKSTILPLGMVSDLILQLKGKKIDTVILDDIVAKAYVKNNDDLMIIENVVLKGDDAGFAVAVPKGDKELLAQVNKTLARLKEENKLEKFLEQAVELNNKK